MGKSRPDTPAGFVARSGFSVARKAKGFVRGARIPIGILVILVALARREIAC
jgi:hypothetical protein